MKYILLVFIFIVSHSVKSEGQSYKMSKRDSLHRLQEIKSILDDTVLWSESLKSILRSDTGFDAWGKMPIHMHHTEDRPIKFSRAHRFILDSLDEPEK
ncbi:MAG: hypothetical protein K0Q79_2593 [Flavipsychrobacter sp.]|jgi:hypothetical protein|nr:hypothetical protein [Flavipsychrobacter sp.]